MQSLAFTKNVQKSVSFRAEEIKQEWQHLGAWNKDIISQPKLCVRVGEFFLLWRLLCLSALSCCLFFSAVSVCLLHSHKPPEIAREPLCLCYEVKPSLFEWSGSRREPKPFCNDGKWLCPAPSITYRCNSSQGLRTQTRKGL